MTLQELARQATDLSAQLETIEASRAQLEGEAITKILDAAKGGLKFERLQCEWTNGTRDHRRTMRYFEDGRRGVRLYTQDNESCYPNDLHMHVTIDEKEPWLMADGSIHLYHKHAVVSRYQGVVNHHHMDFVRVMDPAELDADQVGKRVQALLKERIANLGERTRAQRERIAKLQAMMAV